MSSSNPTINLRTVEDFKNLYCRLMEKMASRATIDFSYDKMAKHDLLLRSCEEARKGMESMIAADAVQYSHEFYKNREADLIDTIDEAYEEEPEDCEDEDCTVEEADDCPDCKKNHELWMTDDIDSCHTCNKLF